MLLAKFANKLCMNAQILDWSDIPYVLAVCESGSLSGAARKLDVNHSTVFRRIEKIEKKLGVTLFERLSHGYVMTAAGEYFFKHSLVLQEGVSQIELKLGGEDLRHEGILTVTTTDSLLHRLTPVFLAFQQQYQGIELRLMSDTRALSLTQREADIALRPTDNPPEQWIGRNLVPVSYATYTHCHYSNAMKKLSPDEYRWVKLTDDLMQSPMSKITAQYKTKNAPATSITSVMGVFDLVCAGLGIAVLPCYLGENNAELVRVHEPMVEFNTGLWILAHPDMRRNARVHAFFEFATAQIRKRHIEFCMT